MHIGRRIREVMIEQGRSHTWLARRLHTVRPNVYDIYRRDSIDTYLLQRISKALGHNFLSDLADDTVEYMNSDEGDDFYEPDPAEA